MIDSEKHIVFAGSYRALEQTFIKEIKHLKSIDSVQPIVVFVPSHLAALHLSRLLPERGIDHLNIRFFTIEDVSLEISRNSRDGNRMLRLPAFADEAIVKSVVEDLSKKVPRFYFAPVSHFPGLVHSILDTVDDLKDASLTPEKLKQLSKNFAGTVRRKIRDLARIWGSYEIIKSQSGWYDMHDALLTATKRIASWKPLTSSPRLLIYGFYDFNALQQSLIEAAAQSKAATIFFPFEEGVSYAYALPTKKWLGELGFGEISLTPTYDGTDALTHLNTNLFNAHKAYGGSEHNVVIISAPGEQAEAQEAVRALLQICLERDIDLSRTGILLRKPQPYSELFGQILGKVGIQAYIPGAATLAGAPAGKCAQMLGEIYETNYSREKVIELANLIQPYMAHDGVDLWDAITIRAGIIKGRQQWLERLKAYEKALSQPTHSSVRSKTDNEKEALRSLTAFFKHISQHLNEIETSPTWGSKAKAMNNLLANIAQWESPKAGDPMLEEVRDEIEGLSYLDGVGHPTTSEFMHAVQSVLENASVPSGRFQRNGPAIVSVMAARGLNFDVVVVPGLIDGYFPAKPSEDPILTENERVEINKLLGGTPQKPLTLKTLRRYDEERLLFKIATSCASKCLVLSYPRLEPYSMREHLPSPFLYAVIGTLEGKEPIPERLATSTILRYIPLSRIAPEDPTRALTRREFEVAIAAEGLNRRKITSIVDFLSTEKDLTRIIEAEAKRWGKPEFTQFDGMLTSEDARQRLARDHSIEARAISPTAFETYARCPFKYFLSYILSVEPAPEPADLTTLDPALRGELVHSILYEFFSDLVEKRGRPLRLKQSDWNLLKRIAKRKFEEYATINVFPYTMIWESEKSRIMEHLETFFEDTLKDEAYLPAYFELMWGYDKSYEGAMPRDVYLEMGKRKIHLCGRIDRIDLSKDGTQARVVDYKTGKARVEHDDFNGGRNLQLPMYILAARAFFESLARPVEITYAAYFFLMEEPRKREIRFHTQILGERWKDFETLIGTIVNGIENGYFFAVPDRYSCSYCDFREICGSSQQYIFERKQGDRRILPFLQMRDEK